MWMFSRRDLGEMITYYRRTVLVMQAIANPLCCWNVLLLIFTGWSAKNPSISFKKTDYFRPEISFFTSGKEGDSKSEEVI